jgi:hypothetical protein
VLEALQKEPAARYATASELADDIDRFLAGQPIAARAPTVAYRLRKLVARNAAVSAGAWRSSADSMLEQRLSIAARWRSTSRRCRWSTRSAGSRSTTWARRSRRRGGCARRKRPSNRAAAPSRDSLAC